RIKLSIKSLASDLSLMFWFLRLVWFFYRRVQPLLFSSRSLCFGIFGFIQVLWYYSLFYDLAVAIDNFFIIAEAFISVK
ncbi:hypothetical protein, partial [Eubacterium barkeri]|uniref:hypothetical protein n=1 Tax=Eubacterium barkeri TaxID=1528 RepID=UPI001A9A4876